MKYYVVISLSATLLTAGIAIWQARQPAQAQKAASLTGSPITIRDLQQQGLGVTISGQITSVVGNEFIVSDGTGQIFVDAGPMWYHQLNLQMGEQVTVVGEYDDYDFDAFTITRGNGEVLTIRATQGPPPWAGGPNRQRHRQD